MVSATATSVLGSKQQMDGCSWVPLNLHSQKQGAAVLELRVSPLTPKQIMETK